MTKRGTMDDARAPSKQLDLEQDTDAALDLLGEAAALRLRAKDAEARLDLTDALDFCEQAHYALTRAAKALGYAPLTGEVHAWLEGIAASVKDEEARRLAGDLKAAYFAQARHYLEAASTFLDEAAAADAQSAAAHDPYHTAHQLLLLCAVFGLGYTPPAGDLCAWLQRTAATASDDATRRLASDLKLAYERAQAIGEPIVQAAQLRSFRSDLERRVWKAWQEVCAAWESLPQRKSDAPVSKALQGLYDRADAARHQTALAIEGGDQAEAERFIGIVNLCAAALNCDANVGINASDGR
jgi:hypothetical protein